MTKTSEHQQNGVSLGQEAYAATSDSPTTVELLQNLEGQPIHRLTEGTGEHAGTALAAVELPTGEGLGLQVCMHESTDELFIYPNVTETEDGLSGNHQTVEPIDDIEDLCPDCYISEIAHKDIMTPPEAKAFLVLCSEDGETQFALELFLDDGGLNFFGVAV